jgi:membrane-associated phospholipid phosphatase
MAGANRATTAMWTMAVFFAIVAAAGLAGLDGIVAAYTGALGHGGSIWAQGLALTDKVAMLEATSLLVPSVLMLAAGLLLLSSSTRQLGFALLYVGLVQLLAAGSVEVAAVQLGRVPPFEVVASGDVWFAGGRSFPDLRTAFVAGLFFPFVLLIPRLGPLWAIPPLFVAAASVLAHVHYLSDVAASLALAAALAAGFARLAERGRS